MKYGVAIITGALLVGGCATQPDLVIQRPAIDLEPYRSVAVARSAEEIASYSPFPEMPVPPEILSGRDGAQVVARCCFALFLGGCGSTTFAGETEVVWVFWTAVGYAGSPGPRIIVAKDRSVFYVEGGPEVYAVDGGWVMDRNRFETLEEQIEKQRANQALQTTPMTRSVCEKTIEFGRPQRGV